MKIILIEDDRDLNAVFKEILEIYGFCVDAFTSLKALKDVDFAEYRAIVSDFRLGSTTIQELLAQPGIRFRLPKIKILVTGCLDEPCFHRGVLGDFTVIHKPFAANQLPDILLGAFKKLDLEQPARLSVI